MSAIRDFARRLVAFEAKHDPSPVVYGRDVARALEKLRIPLAKLAGTAGFRSLMSRAVAVAKAEVPSLAAVKVRPDGSLEGLQLASDGPDAEAQVVVVAELLGLLLTFIGEALTMRLVCEAWPHAPIAELGAGSGEKS